MAGAGWLVQDGWCGMAAGGVLDRQFRQRVPDIDQVSLAREKVRSVTWNFPLPDVVGCRAEVPGCRAEVLGRKLQFLRGAFGVPRGLLPGIRHVEQYGMPCSPEPCFHRQTPAAGARYLEA